MANERLYPSLSAYKGKVSNIFEFSKILISVDSSNFFVWRWVGGYGGGVLQGVYCKLR